MKYLEIWLQWRWDPSCALKGESCFPHDCKLLLLHLFWHQLCVIGKRNLGNSLEDGDKKYDFILSLGRWVIIIKEKKSP